MCISQVSFAVMLSRTENEFTFTFSAKALDRPTVVNLTNHTYCKLFCFLTYVIIVFQLFLM